MLSMRTLWRPVSVMFAPFGFVPRMTVVSSTLSELMPSAVVVSRPSRSAAVRFRYWTKPWVGSAFVGEVFGGGGGG